MGLESVATAAIIAGVIILFLTLMGLVLWWDARDVEARRARGETIDPPSMWP